MATEKYRKLIESVDLKEFFVLECHFARPDSLAFPLKIDNTLEIGRPTSSEDAIAVNVTLKLVASDKESQERNVTIDITWRVVYSFSDLNPKEFDDELISRFLAQNIPLNVWPYARAAVTAATADMGLPPLILETYKVFG